MPNSSEGSSPQLSSLVGVKISKPLRFPVQPLQKPLLLKLLLQQTKNPKHFLHHYVKCKTISSLEPVDVYTFDSMNFQMTACSRTPKKLSAVFRMPHAIPPCSAQSIYMVPHHLPGSAPFCEVPHNPLKWFRSLQPSGERCAAHCQECLWPRARLDFVWRGSRSIV